MIKAYMLFYQSPADGCLLVFAETRNKARYLGVGSLYEWEYMQIEARRVPKMDDFYVGNNVIEDNDELPDDAPRFYIELDYEDTY